jgi:MFS family permease
MRPRFTGLWRHPDFLKLWAGETVSVFGSNVGAIALSFTAVITLHASPLQMGLLLVTEQSAGFLAGPLAGVWVDRLRRRPIMLVADLGRLLLLATIPLAHVLGLLQIEQLYAVGFLAGALNACFDVAYQSYLPTLVGREDVLEGNSRLNGSAAAAEIGGFGVAGLLVQVLTAPIAVLVDAFSFLASAAALLAIRTREPEPPPDAERRSVRNDLAEGVRAVAQDPVLRALTGCQVTFSFSFSLIGAVILIFTTRTLGLATGLQGVIFAVGGVTSLLGAAYATRITRRGGYGPTMIVTLLLTAGGMLFLPLAHGAGLFAVGCLVAQQLITDFAEEIFSIDAVSLRQSIAPERLLGRVNATVNVLGWGAMLLGSLAGGAIGQAAGPRATLVVGACGTALAVLWLLPRPLRRLRTAPQPAESPA